MEFEEDAFATSEMFVTYSPEITSENIYALTHFDLTKHQYHGGSTLSSGALPKWDLLDNSYMIKRCSIDEYGNQLVDAVNEELIHHFCNELGVSSAYYRVVSIKYKDYETGLTKESQAVLTRIFDGLVRYRDIRQRLSLGHRADAYLEFSEKFNVQPELNDLLFIDFITNQNDRHSKNFGLVGNQMSPIYDSGSCFFVNALDAELSEPYYDRIPNHKTFGRRLDEQLEFALKHVHFGFSFEFDEYIIYNKFQSALERVSSYYDTTRLEFLKTFVKRRLAHVGRLLVEAQKHRDSTRQTGD